MGMPAYLQPDLEADLILPSTPAGSFNYQDRTAFLLLFFPSLLLVLRLWLWGGCLSALSVQLYQVDKTSLLRCGHGTYQSHLGDPEAGYYPSEGCSCSCNGLSCKELQCFYKIDINGKGFVHILHSARLGEWTLFGEKLLESTVNYGCWYPFYSYYRVLKHMSEFCYLKLHWLVLFLSGRLLPVIVMAVGNFANTVQTLVAKSGFKAKMKKTRSKLELN